jgi:alcohol dehydrogenase class IV
MTAMALSDPSCGGNPLPLTEQAVTDLYRDCI